MMTYPLAANSSGLLAPQSHSPDRRVSPLFGSEENQLGVRRPGKRSNPAIESLGQFLLLSRLPVVQHQTPAVALVSRTRLRAIGDVLPIRRIERSLIRRLVVGSDVLGLEGRDARPSINWDCKQIIVGADGFNFIVVRGEAN